MTRKDYVLLSAALKAERAEAVALGCSDTLIMGIDGATCAVADALAKGNRAFDRARFLKDAGAMDVQT